MSKPYASDCDENKGVILDALRPLLANKRTILEIGSGTGQHAVYFAQNMSHLLWQPSDLAEHHAGMMQWLNEAHLDNLLAPIELNVSTSHWPDTRFDGIFSANTLHIMNSQNVEDLFHRIAAHLNPGGLLIVYGPFNVHGHYTSESNARFDAFLKARDPQSGIKDTEWLNSLAQAGGLIEYADIAMPQNNRILCWKTHL
jgi:cyclopropane fatty-acyl-phospholipid synthase-like methyltransferase